MKSIAVVVACLLNASNVLAGERSVYMPAH